MTTVALDVGKTKVRLSAIDESGAELDGLARPNRVRPGPPYPHFDVDDLFDWIVDGLRALGRRHEITEIVPIAHGACAALLSGDSLVLPVLDYEFEGPEELDDYEPLARRFAETLSPRLPAGLNLGRQLAWLAARFPTELARVDRILLLPQYWTWRLCGASASELTSLGCHTDLWAPEACGFSTYARARGFDRLFPPVRRAWERAGRLRAEIASRAGIHHECAVLTGIHDSNASYFAHRVARESEFAVVSSGTWVVVMAHGGSVAEQGERRDTLANVDAFGEPIPTARFMGGREFAAIAGEKGASLATEPADVLATIERGDLALPSFAPGVGPFPQRKGEIASAARASPLMRAALASLYCALVTDVCLDLVGARGDLLVEGPFARNRGLLFALAGLRPRQRVIASSDVTGTLVGAARLAGWSRGERPAAAPSGTSNFVEPEARKLLASHRERWRAAIG